ncbi:MAG TPA: bifunctional phosphopantothenoylcysteine decarboxylase/phosphopantothenate--cysteine ligase CoaBC [Anaerolineales bacterium]|nr:bifunctional phosphopantothenoylcysteine decarboxylase/phosphopantothenate--cysteine ligase CoaBC [Anaerolineales bacterium]
MTVLNGRHILLGVTGSIAAFKAADLASKLSQLGAQVDVVLTPGAEKFITPLTFQSVTGRHAYTDADLWGGEAHILHIGLSQGAELLVIAPCTANTISKLAYGAADNLLTITALACKCPLVIAPAMDGGMFEAAVTQGNLGILTERGATIAGPAEGRFASGLTGKGRLLEPAELIGQIRLVLGRNGQLAGKKVVVSAGGTQEPLDPVRVLTNRSSGRQGYALAQAALDWGAQVTLISAPTNLNPPVGAQVVAAPTAHQMYKMVLSESAKADVLIMAAAVADFRPRKTAKDKMKKREGIPQVELEETEDILKAVAVHKSRQKRPRVLVGFAAESRDLLVNAGQKLRSKKLDFIVANDIASRDAGFSVETNRVTLLFPNGKKESLPLMSKAEVAEAVIKHIAALLE